MHTNRDAVFFELAGPELVLFITDGLWGPTVWPPAGVTIK